ncbi:heme-binding protein [Riemerella anatipestifer]|uniref:heme-binding protein n=1 Tax=Riemerella anatipestifer TaxID=34085 RepID=UPI0021AB01EC|nr:heme-binding protein [Riemerella anatipestifer]
MHTLRASYKKAFTANSQKEKPPKLHKASKWDNPEDVRYLDENILILDGGVPIYIDGKVVAVLV